MNCPKCQAQLSTTARFCERCGAMQEETGNPGVDPLIGRVLLERYRVLEAIGQGGMGSVYLAEQRMGQATRKVAIKALRRDLSRDAQLTGRFHRESEIVIQLSHPNIIQFHDFGELDDGTLIIVMEYIEGGTLHALLRKDGALPMERADHLLGQIVGALDEAHRHGVVHRDLKPQNILITTRGDDQDFVKVVDFGIAARSASSEGPESEEDTRLTSKGTVIGTPAYMSPEQFRGEEPDARADVYSLAVIAYEMLTGKLPLQARTPWEWASQHLTAAPEPFETHIATVALPPHIASAVMRGLSKDREQRWADARSLLRALRGQPNDSLGPTRVLPRFTPASAPRESAAPTREMPSALSLELPLAQTAPAPRAVAPAKSGGKLGTWLLAAGVLLAIGAWLRAAPPAPAAAPAPEPVLSGAQAPKRDRTRVRPEPPEAVAVTAPATIAEAAAAIPTTAPGAAAAPTAIEPGGTVAEAVPAAAIPAAAEVEPAATAEPAEQPSARPADGADDSNQLLAHEGVAALADGRLGFAITALETAASTLGNDDPAVVELRAALLKHAGALLIKKVEAGDCTEARRQVAQLTRLGVPPSPDPLEGANACTSIGPTAAPPP